MSIIVYSLNKSKDFTINCLLVSENDVVWFIAFKDVKVKKVEINCFKIIDNNFKFVWRIWIWIRDKIVFFWRACSLLYFFSHNVSQLFYHLRDEFLTSFSWLSYMTCILVSWRNRLIKDEWIELFDLSDEQIEQIFLHLIERERQVDLIKCRSITLRWELTSSLFVKLTREKEKRSISFSTFRFEIVSKNMKWFCRIVLNFWQLLDIVWEKMIEIRAYWIIKRSIEATNHDELICRVRTVELTRWIRTDKWRDNRRRLVKWHKHVDE